MTSRRTLLAGAAVMVVALVVTTTVGGRNSDPAPGLISAANPAGARAAVLAPEHVPTLRGRRPQRDINPRTPSVRRYTRRHRLLIRLPVTHRGVTFTVGGRSRARVLVLAETNGHPPSVARRAYADLLHRYRDRGHAYRLRIVPPTAGPTP